MEVLEQLSIALGLATLAGLNLYLTVFITGLAIRFDLIELFSRHEQLAVLASDPVLIASGIFVVLEFFSDKIPWVDSLWDAIHTLIRPVGGALLAMSALGETSIAFEVIVAMLAGSATLVTHGFKAGTRLAINASPEPVTNIAASVTEDAAVVGGFALMALNPFIAAAVFIVFLAVVIWLTPKLFRRSRAFLSLLFRKIGGRASQESKAKPRATLSADEMLALTDSLGGRKPEILWSARVITGKAKGFKSIGGQTFGVIAAEKDSSGLLHFVGRRFWRTFHSPIPLEGMEVTQESRFLSEDVVIFSGNGNRRLQLRLHAGNRDLAEKVVAGLFELRNGVVHAGESAETEEPGRETDAVEE